MKFALIGQSLSHSYSRELHTGYGLDYVLHEVKPEALGDFVAHCPYDGYNVTVPYKQAVIPYLDALTEKARRLGAVNTVRRVDGKWIGDNTDYDGFAGALTRLGVDVRGKSALVLGSGGASQVVQAVLRDMGAKVTVVSRTGEVNYDNCYERQDTAIIVNATPVGTHPHLDETPIDLARFGNLQLVYDLVYNPKRTRLVYEAERLGIPCSGGLGMLVIQALAAREIWLGTPYTEEEVNACIRRLRAKTDNIALIGMPSVGKSTIGLLLAAKTQRSFVDTDVRIHQTTGATPASIIRTMGEDVFRDVEEEAVRDACNLHGAVLALGGGAILREVNRRRLRQTATVIWLTRDLDKLVATDRPTLQRAGAEALYALRRPLYEQTADYVVPNEDVDQTVQTIVELLHLTKE